jgi:hypothetical protein
MSGCPSLSRFSCEAVEFAVSAVELFSALWAESNPLKAVLTTRPEAIRISAALPLILILDSPVLPEFASFVFYG